MNGVGLQAPPWWQTAGYGSNPYQSMTGGSQALQTQATGAPGWMMPLSFGMGALGVLGEALQPGLNLPSFGGGQYMGQARQAMRPELQAALARSASLGAQEQASLGANLAQMGVSGGSKLSAIHNMVRAGQAQRDLQAYAGWQKNITDMAMQLYQLDMQRQAAEYEANRGGGFGGFLSGLGQLGASILPLALL